jgi:hypothetical protein
MAWCAEFCDHIYVEKLNVGFLIFEQTSFFLILDSCHRRTVALLKSDKDNRYGLDSVVTHDGTKMPCWAVSQLSCFHEKLGIEAYEKVWLTVFSLCPITVKLFNYTALHICSKVQIEPQASYC